MRQSAREGGENPEDSAGAVRHARGTRGRVCVVGLGYVGLPTAALLGTRGWDVLGVDTSKEVVQTVNAGRVHIQELGLEERVRLAVRSKRLRASRKPILADVFLIAVPTPILPDRRPDLSLVEAATDSLLSSLRPGNLVLVESTCPVGTTEVVVAERIAKAGHTIGEAGVRVAYCPERVLPGSILDELIHNDRIVGGIDASSTEQAARFYESFVEGVVLRTDARTAEMVKLTENAYRDVNIAFANELSMLCGQTGVDVWELIRLANRHPRVGVLEPGPGVGGHCVAVDPWFLIGAAPECARLTRVAREVNDSKPEWVLERVRQSVQGIDAPVIACLGLTFKADIGDLRESPALEVCRKLADEQLGELLVVEPFLDNHPEFVLWDLDIAVRRADVILVLVDHQAFRSLRDRSLSGKRLVDTRGLLR